MRWFCPNPRIFSWWADSIELINTKLLLPVHFVWTPHLVLVVVLRLWVKRLSQEGQCIQHAQKVSSFHFIIVYLWRNWQESLYHTMASTPSSPQGTGSYCRRVVTSSTSRVSMSLIPSWISGPQRLTGPEVNSWMYEMHKVNTYVVSMHYTHEEVDISQQVRKDAD